jgi:ferric-dicitrate binding protein FerR (iron transport regulator)
MTGSRPSLAKLAMRELADAPLDVEAPSRRAAEAAIAEIARELEAARARRRRWAAGLVALAVAAAVSVASTALLRGGAPAADAATAAAGFVSGGVMLVRGDQGATLATGAGIRKGDRIVASAGGAATLRLRKATELRATRGADVLVAEQGAVQIYDLRAGTVDMRVTKLEPGERFVVRTSDAEVEVRGTEFRVDVGEVCAGTTTRVTVREGTVVVRHGDRESRVTANEHWPAGCGERTSALSTSSVMPPPSPATPSPALTSPPPSPVPSSAAAPPPEPPRAAPSDLSEQNRLFAEAMAAKRRGDAPGALSALDRLVTGYPRGPLAESAYVERMRVLASADRRRAAEAARTYLSRYPKGYARDEARALSSSP